MSKKSTIPALFLLLLIGCNQVAPRTNDAETTLGALFFEPFRKTHSENLERDGLSQSEIDRAMKVALYEYAGCLIDAIGEWDDPASDYYNDEIVLGLMYDDVGSRPDDMSKDDHSAWLEKVKILAPICERRAESTLPRTSQEADN